MSPGMDIGKDLQTAYDEGYEAGRQDTPHWISVKDRLPDKAGIYIICDHYGNVMSRHFCKSHGKFAGYWHFNGSAKYGNPLYWMPLQEPPKEEENE